MLTCPVWLHLTAIQRQTWPVRYHPLRENIVRGSESLGVDPEEPMCSGAIVRDHLPELPQPVPCPVRRWSAGVNSNATMLARHNGAGGTGSCFQYHPSAARPNRWQFVRPNRRSFDRVITFLMRGLYHFPNPSSYCFVLRFENNLANPKYQSLSRVELTVVSSTTSSPSMALTRSSTSEMA